MPTDAGNDVGAATKLSQPPTGSLAETVDRGLARQPRLAALAFEPMRETIREKIYSNRADTTRQFCMAGRFALGCVSRPAAERLRRRSLSRVQTVRRRFPTAIACLI